MTKKILLSMQVIAITSFANFAQADGLEKVDTFLENVQGILTGIAVATVTIAILWVGYKVLWGGQTLREVAPIIIGAVLIGAAAQIASLLVG